jgi:membrane-associated phospholipid phosphatase
MVGPRSSAVNKYLHRKELVILVALATLALVISLFAHFEPRFPGDLRLTLLFQSVHSSFLLRAMEDVTYVAGSWRASLIVFAGGIVVWRWLGRLEGGMVLLAGLVSLINGALKIAVDRPRPTDVVTVFIADAGRSFPSGHAFFAVLVMGMLAYLAFTHLSKRGQRILSLSAFAFLALLIGASRVYLGAHWTSDVIGGYIVGGVFLVGLVWSYRVLKDRLGARS